MVKQSKTYFYISGSPSKFKIINPYYYMNCVCEATNGRLLCKCGEVNRGFEWIWAKENHLTDKKLSNNNKEVTFHPYYSTGTAAVRGEKPLQKNGHYYWEVKILTKLYGTDVVSC